MKKTEYKVYCGRKGRYGDSDYRTVFSDGERFFVRIRGNLYDVTEDIEQGRFERKNDND